MYSALFQGFYAVYREVFKTVAGEDYEFMDDKDSDFEFPEFGTSQSDYEEVSHAGFVDIVALDESLQLEVCPVTVFSWLQSVLFNQYSGTADERPPGFWDCFSQTFLFRSSKF